MANNLYNTMYNPDVLSCIANLSNDEVFTPPEVANAMLDLLPQELFSDPNTTFLDKTTPRLIQFHTFKNAVNPPFLGGFSIFSTVAAWAERHPCQ